MKITLKELEKRYHNRCVVLGKTFEVLANGNTATDTLRLMKATIHINTDENTVLLECIRKTKTPIHEKPCCHCGYKPEGYSYGIRMDGLRVSDINAVYVTAGEDSITVTLIGEYTSATFEIYD